MTPTVAPIHRASTAETSQAGDPETECSGGQ